jgi:hypothetical protein
MNQSKAYALIVFLLPFLFLTYSGVGAATCNETDNRIQTEADIIALAGCEKLYGHLLIESETLTNIDGLENLEEVVMGITIRNNPVLTDINGLQGLQLIAFDLFIENNDALTSLDGLGPLLGGILGDVIQIGLNDNLADVTALYGVEFTGNFLNVYANAMLTPADADALYENLAPPEGVFNGYFFNQWNGAASTDSDDDGINDLEDNCPDQWNGNQADSDGDGLGNFCDNCYLICNIQQLDADEDGIGDVCDTEDDGCFSCGNGPICETEC